MAISCSCCQREDIITWADKIILMNSNPDHELIEVSTSSSWHLLDLISKLREISIDSNQYSALRTVCGRMYEIGSIKKQKLGIFARGLYQIAIENQHVLPEDLLFCNSIEDEYYLAYSGNYLDFVDVEDCFLNDLKNHWTLQSSTNSWYTEEANIV